MLENSMAPGRSVAQVSSIIPNLSFFHVPNDLVLLSQDLSPRGAVLPQKLTKGFSLQDLQVSTYCCSTPLCPCFPSSLSPLFPRNNPPREAAKLCRQQTLSSAKGKNRGSWQHSDWQGVTVQDQDEHHTYHHILTAANLVSFVFSLEN